MPKKAKSQPKSGYRTASADDVLLDDLNPEQAKAVTHRGGPLLIVAGAGTGKTMVISRRFAWLIREGLAKPEEILALTFTDKAAGEMVERIDQLLPLGYADLWVSTFHSFCQRLLTEHALDIGLPNDFRLLNETDAYLLVRRHLDQFDLDYYRPLGNPSKFIHALLKHFSRAKDEAVTPQEYLDFAKRAALAKDNAAIDAEEQSRLGELARAYATYQKLLLNRGCLDFGDLLLYAIELFRERPKLLEKYRQQFKHVVVDEFQDTNWAQYELLKMLVPPAGNIIVVGDDDQAIYKFRGASVSNILQFRNDFPSSKAVVLTRNYRSLQNILDRSHEFIRQNDPNRLEAKLAGPKGSGITKDLKAARPGQAAVEHLHFRTLDEEAAGVVDRILKIKADDPEATWNDFCILARSNSGANPFCDELQRRGLPYQFLALKGLYAKPVVLDCLAYFKLLDDYHESPALYRVLTSPAFRLDGDDLVKLVHEARKKAESLYETLKRHRLIGLTAASHATVDRLLGLVEKHSELARRARVGEVLVRFLYDSGYAEELKRDDTQEARERTSFLNQFLKRIRRFEELHDEPTLRHFLEEFELERDAGEAGSLAFDVETGPDMVRILTVHAAKGLEFKHVFVVSLVDKRFPASDRGGDIELPDALTKEIVPEGDIHLQEERRLFYVAMTRAKDGLFFTSADDYGGKTKKKPSRFLAELGYAQTERGQATPGLAALRPPTESRPVERKPEIEPPKYFSFTQLAAYANCPLQYKFAHVLRLPVFGKPQFSFGKTMHATLQKFLEELARRQATKQATLFGDAPAGGGLALSLAELLKLYEESWQDDWYPDRPTKEKYRQKGRELLEAFYRVIAERPPRPLFLERDFKVRLGEYWLRGKIDRIDRFDGEQPAASERVEIIDYKTGQPKDEVKLSSDDKRQLMLYQLAAERALNLKPGRLTFHYLEGNATVSFLGESEELAKFEADTVAQIERIKTGDYEATPGRHCAFCDFADICEFRD